MTLVGVVGCSKGSQIHNKNNFAPVNQDTGIKTDADKVGSSVVYGNDDRLDLYQITDPRVLEMAQSTVALVETENIRRLPNGWAQILSVPLGRSYDLCSDERFYNQPVAPFCSGFLVTPNKVVTAGHCIQTSRSCRNTKFVFDYSLYSDQQDLSKLPESNVYSCKRIVETQLKPDGHDFAIIELDRPVTNRQPLPMRLSGQPLSGESVFVIGHPEGLPTKVAEGARVRNVLANYFVANLDTFGGNSGSAVFNSSSLEVEGILVRGEQDFEYDSKAGCVRTKYCKDDQCSGEESTHISLVLPFVTN